MWKCNKCQKTWNYPIEKCLFCKEQIKHSSSNEFIVEGITKVFVESTGHRKAPYFDVLLKDENGDFHIKKTFKEYKIGDKFLTIDKTDKIIVATSKIGYSIISATKRVIKLIGGLDIKPEDKVLIKPNIVVAKSPSSGIVTNPLVVEGIIQYLIENGHKRDNIIIAEGSLEMIDHMTAIKKSGYFDLCNKYNIKFIDLLKTKFINKEINIEGKKRVVQVSEEIFKADKIINVPVIKTHFQTGVSLSIKNMKGVINNPSRKVMHKDHLQKQIALLSTILPEYVTIADGSIALEGMGPGALGEPANLELIFAGKDPVALDTAICHIIGLNVAKHIKEASKLGLGVSDMKKIQIIGEEVDVIKKKFKAADQKISPHPDFELLDGKPCSGCLNSVWTTLHSLKDISAEEISIFFGSHFDDEMLGYGRIIAIGDCAYQAMKKKGHEVEALRGCPPNEEDQKEFLRKWFKNDKR